MARDPNRKARTKQTHPPKASLQSYKASPLSPNGSPTPTTLFSGGPGSLGHVFQKNINQIFPRLPAKGECQFIHPSREGRWTFSSRGLGVRHACCLCPDGSAMTRGRETAAASGAKNSFCVGDGVPRSSSMMLSEEGVVGTPGCPHLPAKLFPNCLSRCHQ